MNILFFFLIYVQKIKDVMQGRIILLFPVIIFGTLSTPCQL
jgi:hypothetical protein